MNPFEQKPSPIDTSFCNWTSIYPKPYNKNEVDPYTKTRVILMNGTEYEAVWFSHQFQRHCPDNDLRREPDLKVKASLDFGLLEDFDHLYRYSDLLEMETGVKSEQLVGHYTEIMPGRPTIAEHRYPFDNIRNPIDMKTASPITKLNVAIITAAEQQTMNYYMNTSALYHNDIGR